MNNESGTKSNNAGGNPAPPGQEKDFTIIVNGTPCTWQGREIGFKDLVKLAFGSIDTNPSAIYSITYKRGNGEKPEGTMVDDDTVKVKEGMIFNVVHTNKS